MHTGFGRTLFAFTEDPAHMSCHAISLRYVPCMNVTTTIPLMPYDFTTSGMSVSLTHSEAIGLSCSCVAIYIVQFDDTTVLIPIVALHAVTMLNWTY